MESILLFEAYTPKDHDIVKFLSKHDMYLIGGTAIDYWCNKFNLKKARHRSDNDLDFYTQIKNRTGINTVLGFLKKEGFVISDDDYITFAALPDKSIDVDILKDNDKQPSYCFVKQDGIAIMSPLYLFSSKFNRYVSTSDKQRKSVDYVDLLQLLKIIELRGTVDTLEQYLSTQNYSQKEEEILNNLIQTYLNQK